MSRSWLILTALCAAVHAHTVITYPGWRGDNLIQNDTFPYGMQWVYPCGGLSVSSNRTKWPITGGAISIQPGWFDGHETALFYINLGLGTDGPGGGPPNTSFPMLPPFQINGPSNNPYPGSFCLPQVPLPAGITPKAGDEATIQVVETTIHGAALYNCVDITFALPEDVTQPTVQNCFNSTDITFNQSLPNTPTPTPSNASSTIQPTCSPVPSCPSCPTQTSCPKTNGHSGSKEGLGAAFPLGVLALGALGL